MLLIRSLKPSDLMLGLLTSVAACWVSLRLLPPSCGCVRFSQLLALLPHFLWESVLAGVDVARRVPPPAHAAQPRLRHLSRCRFRRGSPATRSRRSPACCPAPCRQTRPMARCVYHCLDDTTPVVEQLWQEERLLAKALVAGRRHG